ncbi:hypothetical protein EDD22DRAFT_1014831, partial [Suillus occidentalis]
MQQLSPTSRGPALMATSEMICKTSMPPSPFSATALALRPQRHPDRPLSIYNLTEALNWRHVKKSPAAHIHEAAQLYHELLPLCPDGTYHRGRGLCLVNHQHCPALDELSIALLPWYQQSGNIDDLDECIQFLREAVSLCPEGHTDRDVYLNNLALSLKIRFNHQGKPDDLDQAISLYEEALRLRPVGHESRDSSLDNLGTLSSPVYIIQ